MSPLHPKNIIFMVADGMSLGVPSLAEPFSRLVRNQPTAWNRVVQDANTALGFFETSSLNSMVTDSAAASSAWNSGSRVFNHVINTLPDGERLVPLAPLAADMGKQIGVVTTATVTHATPAGFLTAHPDRDMEEELAEQILKLAPDVLLGGGYHHFLSEHRSDQRDLRGEFSRAGYGWLSKRSHVVDMGPGTRKLLGLFHLGHFPFSIDWKADPDLQKQIPTLAEMTRLALHHLLKSKNGFVLQVEGARIDHAAHVNDPGSLLWEQLAFDDAVSVVLEFTKDQPDTLVIITSDHATANPGLNGIGPAYDQSTRSFAKLAEMKGSLAALREQLTNTDKPLQNHDELRRIVQNATALQMDRKETAMLLRACRPPSYWFQNDEESSPDVVEVLAGIVNRQTGFGWTSTAHTSDLVPILACGPGREHFQGLLKNTDNFSRLAALLGITHKNRSMTPEESIPFLDPAESQKSVANY